MNARHVFYMRPEARWSHIRKHARKDDIALKIDTALPTIEKTNKSQRGEGWQRRDLAAAGNAVLPGYR